MNAPQADGDDRAPATETAASRPSESWMDLKQTGCCADAQADGVPCDEIGCSCQSCTRSDLLFSPDPRRRATDRRTRSG